eukprot:GILJ01012588.1.p1 GENE.GILJ01012588.1~~GILJ01012588.1.p1  ORF type:complete len:226 (-),score=5.18 GILJ01012588.1:132-809(-)
MGASTSFPSSMGPLLMIRPCSLQQSDSMTQQLVRTSPRIGNASLLCRRVPLGGCRVCVFGRPFLNLVHKGPTSSCLILVPRYQRGRQHRVIEPSPGMLPCGHAQCERKAGEQWMPDPLGDLEALFCCMYYCVHGSIPWHRQKASESRQLFKKAHFEAAENSWDQMYAEFHLHRHHNTSGRPPLDRLLPPSAGFVQPCSSIRILLDDRQYDSISYVPYQIHSRLLV